MEQDESKLVAGLNSGTEQACRAVFDLYHRPLCYYARKFSLSAEEAEDVVSDAFAGLYKSVTGGKQFESLEHVKNFLFLVVRNGAISLQQQTRRRVAQLKALQETVTEEADDSMSHRIETEMLQIIYHSVERLPPECKRIFKMYYLDERGYQDIAAELGLSPQTVRNQKARAIALLRKYIVQPGSLAVIGILPVLSMLGILYLLMIKLLPVGW